MRQMVKTQVVTCNRCSFNNVLDACEQRTYAMDDRYYHLDLCQKHAEMFDRDMGGWTRLSDEIDNPFTTSLESRRKSQYFNDSRREETRRLRELAERAQEKVRADAAAAARLAAMDDEKRLLRLIEEDPAEREARRRVEEYQARHSIPGAMKWVLTEHALDRLELRGYTVRDVLLTASRPQRVIPSNSGDPEVVLHDRDGCRVVLNTRTFAIITVIDRNKRIDEDTPTNQPERKAL